MQDKEFRSAPLISVVVIGRNEGERLVRCLASVAAVSNAGADLEMIYVDSGSTDDSVANARRAGAVIRTVQPIRPCAAVGRNAGLEAARGRFVLFLDGDTILHPDFARRALAHAADPSVAVVWGHRRELRPQDSIYNRVLDLDWVFPTGETAYCGGDALMRREVLAQVGGFDETLIAGEEPELCRRIRGAGCRILHIDAPMTGHDLAIRKFSQYWRRAFRSGHAYAELATRFAHTADPLWRAEAARSALHGGAVLALPLAAMAGAAAFSSAVPVALLGAAVAAVVARSAVRARWKDPSLATRLAYATHSHLQQLPILAGQMAFHLDRLRGRRRALIDYKEGTR
jgi:glycosyltransferase involved in cell wall biosynthesis